MRRLIAILLVVVAFSGCNLKNVPEAREEATRRWYHTRAKILHGVATEHFKSGQLDKARIKILEALALDEDYIEGRLLLGKIYIEQGEYSLAVGELKRVHREVSESPEVLYLLGVAQEKAGQLDEALASYRRSQTLDKTSSKAVMAAAEVLAGRDQIQEARLYVESYLSIAENEPGIYELAGRLAMMQRNYDGAVLHYRQAVDLDYKNIRYAESLGRAQFFAGRYAEAMETFMELMKSREYTPAAWLFTMLGDCHMAMGRLHNARSAYSRATEISPSDPGVWSNLAKIALAMKETTPAILAARRALTLDGKSLEGALLLGYALLRDDQVNRSLNVLTQGVGRHPDSAELHCVLGRAHAANGNEAKAMRCYAAALRLDPTNVLAKELLNGEGTQRLSEAN